MTTRSILWWGIRIGGLAGGLGGGAVLTAVGQTILSGAIVGALLGGSLGAVAGGLLSLLVAAFRALVSRLLWPVKLLCAGSVLAAVIALLVWAMTLEVSH